MTQPSFLVCYFRKYGKFETFLKEKAVNFINAGAHGNYLFCMSGCARCITARFQQEKGEGARARKNGASASWSSKFDLRPCICLTWIRGPVPAGLVRCGSTGGDPRGR